MMVVSSVVIATSMFFHHKGHQGTQGFSFGLKTKTRPSTGRGFNSRGSTRFIPKTLRSDGISLRPLTEPSVQLTRCQLTLAPARSAGVAESFLLHARGWFSVAVPGKDSQPMIFSLCQAWTTYSSRSTRFMMCSYYMLHTDIVKQ